MLRCMLVVALLMLGVTPSVMGQSAETLQNQIQVLEGIVQREPDPAVKKALQFQIDSVKEQLKKAGSQPIQQQYEEPEPQYGSDSYYDSRPYDSRHYDSRPYDSRPYDHRYAAQPRNYNYGQARNGNQQISPPIRFNNNGGYGVGGLNVTQNGVYRRGTPTQPGFGISKSGTNLYNVRYGNLRFPIRW